MKKKKLPKMPKSARRNLQSALSYKERLEATIKYNNEVDSSKAKLVKVLQEIAKKRSAAR